jgi:hypothetical protein
MSARPGLPTLSANEHPRVPQRHEPEPGKHRHADEQGRARGAEQIGTGVFLPEKASGDPAVPDRRGVIRENEPDQREPRVREDFAPALFIHRCVVPSTRMFGNDQFVRPAWQLRPGSLLVCADRDAVELRTVCGARARA